MDGIDNCKVVDLLRLNTTRVVCTPTNHHCPTKTSEDLVAQWEVKHVVAVYKFVYLNECITLAV